MIQRDVSPRLRRFVHRQAEDLRTGGRSAIRRKVLALLGMGLAAFPVLLVRILGPVLRIRFGRLPSDRLGHFIANTELYLCERDAETGRGRNLDIFYHASPISNHQLKKMWDRELFTFPPAGLADRFNRWLPGGERHVVPFRRYQDRDIHGLLRRMPAHLALTPEEERRGYAGLRELGIPEGAPFVCFHSRDSAYLDAVQPPPTVNGDWRYHDFRDSSVHNHVPAAEELARRGYFGIRMGATVREALETDHPMIVDYATEGRTDFLDIFLCAKCEFYVGDPCGLCAVPMIFRRPKVLVNQIPLEITHTWGPNYLFIPKKLWLTEERRFLTFREIFASGIGWYLQSEQYQQDGIEPVENTPEEITALVVEMDERLKGTWQDAEEGQELQRRFWSLFKASELHGEILSRIGAQFLRENRELLE